MKGSKKLLKILAALLLVFALVIAAYVAYVFIDYHRIEDNQPLEVNVTQGADKGPLVPGETYSAVSYNVGFGAYTPDYSFFMDGGKYSWAMSPESATETILGAAGLVKDLDTDFALFQEIDIDATRTYHIDQKKLFDDALDYGFNTYAIDFDSPFLFWPPTQPHGKSLACLATYSKHEITDGLRRSLPISTSFSKLVDLDRCYSISRIPVSNGKELALFCVHLSAYGTDDSVRDGQLSMLTGDMKAEIEKGNYVVCGGDFNHDLLAAPGEAGEQTWAFPFEREALGDRLTLGVDLLSEGERNALNLSCRNADMPYVEGETFVVNADGFIISDNVEMVSYRNLDTDFLWSDHEPVVLEFRLNP